MTGSGSIAIMIDRESNSMEFLDAIRSVHETHRPGSFLWLYDGDEEDYDDFEEDEDEDFAEEDEDSEEEDFEADDDEFMDDDDDDDDGDEEDY